MSNDPVAQDLIARLLADELPGDRQYQREARTVLAGLLREAAEYIRKKDALNLNGYPRLLVSVLAVSSTGEKCMEFGLASPIKSGVEAFDAAIEQLQKSRDTIRRQSYLDWHIQINIRAN